MENYQGITGEKSKILAPVFFVIGLIGALGFRLVLLINKISSFFSSLVWYVAIVSYIFFYFYRFYIEKRRKEIIINNKLRKKLIEGNLEENDKEKLRKVLDSILVSKLNWNFLILIILSILALVSQIIADILL